MIIELGKNEQGNIVKIDLAELGHLLISGCTGSGKSVCINAILANLLSNNSPHDVKIICFDMMAVN
jgi:S-DNA-T family DNA segregation ATPase FtsK/SpoIIIE